MGQNQKNQEVCRKELLTSSQYTVGLLNNRVKDLNRSRCHCSCSIPKSWPTLCNPMDCSAPGFAVFTISPNLPKLKGLESCSISLKIHCRVAESVRGESSSEMIEKGDGAWGLVSEDVFCL